MSRIDRLLSPLKTPEWRETRLLEPNDQMGKCLRNKVYEKNGKGHVRKTAESIENVRIKRSDGI